MVILERHITSRDATLPPLKKVSTITRLEGQIHARRLEIKGLSSSLHMLGVLNANGLADSDFPTEKSSIVNRMLELNRKQHIDRKQLRPHKRAREIKGKSPFNHAININVPPEFKSGVRGLQPRAKVETTSMSQKPKSIVIYERRRPKESNADEDPLTIRVTEIRKQLESLGIQKENEEISRKEYRKRHQELASELHQTEIQRGHKPIRTKSSGILTGK